MEGVRLTNTDDQSRDVEKMGASLEKAKAIFSKLENIGLKLDKLSPKNWCEILKEFDNLENRDEGLDAWIRRENYRRNHEFLTQQIDERSHQVWTLGSLFVPISFLVFTYVVVNPSTLLSDQFLLMVGSLTCYLAFYYMYRRITLLNDLSYPNLHALELALGLYAHLKLGEFWNKYEFLRRRVRFFTVALYVLAVIWGIHLMLLTNLFIFLIPTGLVVVFHVDIRLAVRKEVPSRSQRRTLTFILGGIVTLFAAAVLWWISALLPMNGIITISFDASFNYWCVIVFLLGILGAILLIVGVRGMKKRRSPEISETPSAYQEPVTQGGAGNQQPSPKGAASQLGTPKSEIDQRRGTGKEKRKPVTETGARNSQSSTSGVAPQPSTQGEAEKKNGEPAKRGKSQRAQRMRR